MPGRYCFYESGLWQRSKPAVPSRLVSPWSIAPCCEA